LYDLTDYSHSSVSHQLVFGAVSASADLVTVPAFGLSLECCTFTFTS
jgi:hypothetical protein